MCEMHKCISHAVKFGRPQLQALQLQALQLQVEHKPQVPMALQVTRSEEKLTDRQGCPDVVAT